MFLRESLATCAMYAFYCHLSVIPSRANSQRDICTRSTSHFLSFFSFLKSNKIKNKRQKQERTTIDNSIVAVKEGSANNSHVIVLDTIPACPDTTVHGIRPNKSFHSENSFGYPPRKFNFQKLPSALCLMDASTFKAWF